MINATQEILTPLNIFPHYDAKLKNWDPPCTRLLEIRKESSCKIDNLRLAIASKKYLKVLNEVARTSEILSYFDALKKIQGTLGLTVFDVVPNLIEWTASDLINEVIETDQQLQKN